MAEDKVPVDNVLQRLTHGMGAVLSAALLHGLLLAAVLSGHFALPEVLGGIVLSGVLGFSLGAVQYYTYSTEPQRQKLMAMAKSFGFMSIGVWGYMGMLMAIKSGDMALLGVNTLLLEGLGDMGDIGDLSGLGDIDDEGIVIVLVIIAAAFFIAAMYFLIKFLLTLGAANLMVLVASVVTLQSLQFLRRRMQLVAVPDPAFAAIQLRHDLRALGFHLFIKGWVGSFFMTLFVMAFASHQLHVYYYIGWSFAYDALLQPLVRSKLIKPYLVKRDDKRQARVERKAAAKSGTTA